jgi:hypothetical protein
LSDRPAFSPAELDAIAHDNNLSSLIDSDPWAVRKYLDALEANQAAKTAPEPQGGSD